MKLDLGKDLYMVGINGNRWKPRPCYYIRKKGYNKDYPIIVLEELGRYNDYYINDEGRVKGRWGDHIVISNNKHPVILEKEIIMTLEDFVKMCCKEEGFLPDYLSARLTPEETFGPSLALINIDNVEHMLKVSGNDNIKDDIRELVKEAKRIHCIKKLAGIEKD